MAHGKNLGAVVPSWGLKHFLHLCTDTRALIPRPGSSWRLSNIVFEYATKNTNKKFPAWLLNRVSDANTILCSWLRPVCPIAGYIAAINRWIARTQLNKLFFYRKRLDLTRSTTPKESLVYILSTYPVILCFLVPNYFEVRYNPSPTQPTSQPTLYMCINHSSLPSARSVTCFDCPEKKITCD